MEDPRPPVAYYDAQYGNLASEVYAEVRAETFGTDLGQSGWLTVEEQDLFIGWLGLEVVSLDHERQEITVRMAMRPELERRPGTRQFHGGPIAAFIDITGDFAIGMLVGGGVPTINLRTDYLRNNPNSAWDRMKGAVRYGWEKVTGKR